jgi:hypothetical protein
VIAVVLPALRASDARPLGRVSRPANSWRCLAGIGYPAEWMVPFVYGRS